MFVILKDFSSKLSRRMLVHLAAISSEPSLYKLDLNPMARGELA